MKVLIVVVIIWSMTVWEMISIVCVCVCVWGGVTTLVQQGR